jgi:ECF transporter S component (folate family)
VPGELSTTKQLAFAAIMSALANVLGYFSIPIGTTKIHFMQLPILLSGLALGPVVGGVVGFTGSVVMAFTLQTPNPFILLGNAILGLCTGLFYSRIAHRKPPIIPQLVAVMGAVAVQFPYTYVSDVYGMLMPAAAVLYTILPKLLIEDLISLFSAHVVLFRIDVKSLLGRQEGATRVSRGDD